MTDDGKKLTVSFGAFSCTLDGYDDPMPVLSRVLEQFQTMAREDPEFAKTAAAGLPEAAVAEETPAADALEASRQSPAAPGDFDAAEALEADWEAYNVAPAEADPVSEPAQMSQDAPHTPARAADPAADPADWDDQIFQALETATPQSADTETDSAFLKQLAEMSSAVDAPQDAAQEATAVEDANFEAPDPSGWSFETETQATELAEPEAISPEPLVLDIPQSAMVPEQVLPEDEDAAIERMISVSRERSAVEPELAPANPLARLREQTEALNAERAEQEDDADANADTGTPLVLERASPDPAPLRLDLPTPSAQGEDPSQDEPAHSDPLRLTPAASDATPPVAAEFEAEPTATEDQAAPAPAPFRLEPDAAISADAPQPDAGGILRLVPTAEAAPVEAPEAAPTPPADGEDLRQFAASMGASSLAELMEASAAYLTIVEGHQHFTRREIFEHFDALSGDAHVSFEARIKTLSRLLRTGVLERSEDGSFSLSTAARAQYEERASA